MNKKLLSKRLGVFVTKRMKERGVSVLGLAKSSGLSLSVVQKITDGRGNPSLFTLKKLAKALYMQIVIWPHEPR